jgi:hypothetical protein
MFSLIIFLLGLFLNNPLHHIVPHHTTVSPCIKYYATLEEILLQNNTNITENKIIKDKNKESL